jgi:hypothetical protein
MNTAFTPADRDQLAEWGIKPVAIAPNPVLLDAALSGPYDWAVDPQSGLTVDNKPSDPTLVDFLVGAAFWAAIAFLTIGSLIHWIRR